MPSHSSSVPTSLPSELVRAGVDIAATNLDWHRLGERAYRPDAQWQHWLFDTGSLTQLLIEKSAGEFSVEVVSERWMELPSAQVRGCFGPVHEKHEFWSRKVVLRGEGEPWVLAHTLIPRFSLQGPLNRVLELSDRPLGEYLFSHPDLVRSGMDITRFAENSWGRRSLFYLFQKPIMVAEFFLPEILV